MGKARGRARRPHARKRPRRARSYCFAKRSNYARAWCDDRWRTRAPAIFTPVSARCNSSFSLWCLSHGIWSITMSARTKWNSLFIYIWVHVVTGIHVFVGHVNSLAFWMFDTVEICSWLMGDQGYQTMYALVQRAITIGFLYFFSTQQYKWIFLRAM